jgi:hypothetical protein
LKDHVDFLAAQIRELKFGTSRVGEAPVSTPPSFDIASRYYDYAGNIAATRSFTTTVGDTISSLGDYNSTSDDLGTVLQTVHDSFDAAKGGSVLVKSGDYVWDATVTVDRPFSVVFSEGVTFVAGTYTATPVAINSSVKVELVGMPAIPVASLPFTVACSDVNGFEFRAYNSTLQVDFSAATTSVTANVVYLEDCVLPCETSTSSFVTTGSAAEPFELIRLVRCKLRYEDTVDGTTQAIMALAWGSCILEDCEFDLAFSTGSANQFVSTIDGTGGDPTKRFSALRCSFIDTNTGKALEAIDIGGGDSNFDHCYFEADWHTTTASAEDRTFLNLQASGSFHTISDCVFVGMDVVDAAVAVDPENSQSTYGAYIRGYKVRIHDCKFSSGDFTNEAMMAVYCGSGDFHEFIDCEFRNFGIALHIRSGSENNTIQNCYFDSSVTDIGAVSNRHILAAFGWNGLRVEGNRFVHFVSNTVTNTYEYRCIDIGHAAQETKTGYTITNNTFDMTWHRGIHRIIEMPAAIDLFNRVSPPEIITGNQFFARNRFDAVGGTSGECWGIVLDNAGLESETSRNILIDGNVFELEAIPSGSDDITAIRIKLEENGEGDTASGPVISNNIINIRGGSDGRGTAVWYQGTSGSIHGNNILLHSDTGGTPAASTGIQANGHWISVQNNRIICRTTMDNAIRTELGPNMGSSGNIRIDGNMIVLTDDVASHNVVLELNGFGTGQPTNLSITNNTLSVNVADDSRLIALHLSSSGTDGASATCSGNVITEYQSIGVGATRAAIYISASGGYDGFVCSNNVVTSYATGLRATNTGAIHMHCTTPCDGTVVNGNAIHGWSTTGANRANIYINNSNRVVVNSNCTDYSGSAGENSIRVTNASSGNVSANETNGGSVDTSGSTVTTTGSNS